MYLLTRHPNKSDLDSVATFAQKLQPFLSEKDSAFRSTLAEILSKPLAPQLVIEDLDRPKEQRILAVFLSCFVRPAFREWSLDPQREPHFSNHLCQWRRGKSGAVLSESEFLKEQRDSGSTLAVLCSAIDRKQLSANETAIVVEHLSHTYLRELFSYKLVAYLEEVQSVEEMRRLTSLDVVVFNSYGASALRLFGKWPFLLGVDFQRMDPRTLNTTYGIGRYYQVAQNRIQRGSRFGFSFREQEILKGALAGRSDAESAHLLRVSLITVKKRWESIYARVALREPELFSEQATSAKNSSPLPQRRRTLLQLLKEHPEELWPSND